MSLITLWVCFTFNRNLWMTIIRRLWIKSNKHILAALAEHLEKAIFLGNLDTFIRFAIGNTGLLLWRVGGGCGTVAGFEVFYAVQVIQ